MPQRKTSSEKRYSKGKGKVIPALCNVLGTVLLLGVISLCLPLSLPRIFGYQAFEVTSGSMEPELPVGSVVFVRKVDPVDIKVDEIIAYRDGDDIITHRVTTNRTSLGEFVTKGDANDMKDPNPVPYDAVIGRVVKHVDGMSAIMSIYASAAGKVYLLLIAACGVMLNVLAKRMRESRKLEKGRAGFAAVVPEDEDREDDGSTGKDADKTRDKCTNEGTDRTRDEGTDRTRSKGRSKGRGTGGPQGRFGMLRQVLVAALAVVFLGSAGVIGYVMWQYHLSDKTYADASDRFTKDPPKTVDFAALRAENPDVIGWIYCEGTVIDYPVLQGKDNDEYLHHDYTGDYNINGSIFVDADNRAGFVDSNTIIYGHHMNSGSMFASLEKWTDQEYYEEHPVMWLLTPEQNYQIVLFSGHHLSSRSEEYEIIHTPGQQMDALLAKAQKESDFNMTTRYAEQLDTSTLSPGVQLDPQGRYVMLSTCAYVFNNARYALHGELVPITRVTN